MHGNSLQRALRNGGRSGAIHALALVACVFIAPAAAVAAASDGEETTSSLGRSAAHELRISRARPGHEAIELSARLEEDGGLVQRSLRWTVLGEDGSNVYQGEQAIAGFKAAPGDYRITARYGAVEVTRMLTLLKEQQVGVTFVLNAGGVRVLPRVNGVALPGLQPETDIYIGGERIARSTLPGEIVRVGAGAYRVVSHFAYGNAEVETQIVVKPGKMRALTFDHKAGVARFKLKSGAAKAEWRVTTADGQALPPAEGAAALFVLKPGDYRVEVNANGARYKTKFTIVLGETRDIVFGE